MDAGNRIGGGGRVDPCPRAYSLPHRPDNQGARAFIDRERGLCAETAQAALTVILTLVTRWSDQSHLDRLSTYRTAHRTWLRILPIALEEELKVLDFA